MSTIKQESKFSGFVAECETYLVTSDPKCASSRDKIASFTRGGDIWQHSEHVQGVPLDSLLLPGFNPYIECQGKEGNRAITLSTYPLINSCKSGPLVVISHLGMTLEAGMTERRNGRMAESQNSRKNDPKLQKGGTAENYPKS